MQYYERTLSYISPISPLHLPYRSCSTMSARSASRGNKTRRARPRSSRCSRCNSRPPRRAARRSPSEQAASVTDHHRRVTTCVLPAWGRPPLSKGWWAASMGSESPRTIYQGRLVRAGVIDQTLHRQLYDNYSAPRQRSFSLQSHSQAACECV